jgi:hypothetical protein
MFATYHQCLFWIYKPLGQVALPEYNFAISQERHSNESVISLVFNVRCEIARPNFAVRRWHMDRCIQYPGIIAQTDRTAATLAAAVHDEVV